ncbi:ThuA domain-containing protein [Fodinibius sp.]|uniref:ThuA domain-containing protein n=1 Tax=Fodinibius sp. TaxID=1872440 RepID=UPI0035692726
MNRNRFEYYLTPLLIGIFFVLSLSYHPAGAQDRGGEESVLLFTKTEGFRHASIPTGVETVLRLTDQEGIRAYHTEDAEYFHPDSLQAYDAVIFLNTTGDILDTAQQEAFEQYIRRGGGFLGIHSAADTEYEWPWYGSMVGAYFTSHPQIQEATIEVLDRSHAATSFLPEKWVRTDEWYNYKNISSKIKVLMELDESSYEGGENGDFHPIAWYHNFDGGRAFYTGLGHTDEAYSEPLFLDHLRGALQYVIGAKQ